MFENLKRITKSHPRGYQIRKLCTKIIHVLSQNSIRGTKVIHVVHSVQHPPVLIVVNVELRSARRRVTRHTVLAGALCTRTFLVW